MQQVSDQGNEALCHKGAAVAATTTLSVNYSN